MKALFASDVEQIGMQRLVYGLCPLVTYLNEHHIDCQPFFNKADIPPQAISDATATMNLHQEQAFIQEAINQTNDPGLGLSIGPRYHLSSYGMLGLAMMSSATLEEGLCTSAQLISLNWSRLRWQTQLNDATVILQAREIEPIDPCLHYMFERDYSAIVTACNEMLGFKLPLKELRFSYPAPTHAERYQTVFNCPIQFNTGCNELLFEASWLDAPLQQANQAVRDVCYAQCEDLMLLLAGNNSLARVIENLIVEGDGNFYTLEHVASKLFMSPRTLRRKLSQEGINFQGLLQRVRSNLAKEMLLSNSCSIEQVAERLGYSDSAAFCHAFKRWTGKSPSAFRL